MKPISLFLFVLLLSGTAIAQDFEFGEVSKEEVQNNTYALDSLAPAVVLHRKRETYYNHEHPEGWLLNTEIHERIKILSKDGLDQGTVKVRIYNKGASKERVIKIKGYTYNMEGGKMVSQKLKNAGIFENKINDNWDEITLTLPNVKVGSVVEFRYIVVSPYFKIDDVVIQDDIPVAHYHCLVRTPGYFKYQRVGKGNFIPNSKDYVKRRNLNVSYEQSVNKSLTQPTRSSMIQIEETVHEYEYKDIPALVEEPYVDNIDNYRYMVTYELSGTEFADGTKKNYSTTWEEVAKTIRKMKSFGGQLDKRRFFRDDLSGVLASQEGEMAKMNAVFDYVKNRMVWNERARPYSSDGIQTAYKNQTGNSADINLLLTAMLKEAGVTAYPVVLSTRDHGIPAYPTLDGFNYVIACAEINNTNYLLDATDKYSMPNVLPVRDLNWTGLKLKDDGTIKKMQLYPETTSQRNTLLNVTIDTQGDVTGKMQSNYTLLEALEFRTRTKDVSEGSQMDTMMEQYGFTEAEAYEVKNKADLEKPVAASCEFVIENGVEQIGDELYFSPLFFLSLTKNPFTLEQRNYPVDFKYPFSHRKIVSVKIPEGYTVSSMPESIKIGLPDNMGSFLFKISENGGVLSIQSNFKMNYSVVPADRYGELKEFYSQRAAKEGEKVVLSKI